MTIFYFTGTGNSLAVAKSIGGNLVSIPQIIDEPDQHYKDDAIGVIFPTYGLAMPKMVRKFLSRAKFETNYLFGVATYGNARGGHGAVMDNLQAHAGKNGYRFNYTNHILMVDNFVNIFEIGAEIAKIPSKKIEEKLKSIKGDIERRKDFEVKSGLGGRILTGIIGSKSEEGGSTPKFIVNDKCNKCGVCAKACPAKNIVDVKFGNKCEKCYACLHNCPQNAIHLKSQKSDARWRHPDVSLNEIIEANNRAK
ncbi:MAG: EFR1 family ferrodoxin [Defluviitaleaceae bacterium]|nr:EFR1 family ferrodoxin [Defluviitaleaceae bacterium]